MSNRKVVSGKITMKIKKGKKGWGVAIERIRETNGLLDPCLVPHELGQAKREL